MATQKEKADMAKARLKKAFALAKDGQYAKARYLVRNMEHPKAKELLALLDGHKEKPKRKSFVSGFSLMVVFVIIAGIGAFAGFAWVMNNYIGNFSLGDLATFDSQTSEEEYLYFDLVSYCYDYTGYAGESCEDWTDSVIRDYHDSSARCFAPYDLQTFFNDQEYAEIRTCLRAAGIPNPS